ncbi:MAG TPA: copper resistance protein CopC [Ktedonobacteraceae bacterium]|nr:copper resistance protein CopC [Ktedonobacteraceae bacterium]
MARWCCLGLLLVALLLLGGLALAPLAEARALHAALLRSAPADQSVLDVAPQRVELWFSEPVQTVGPSITVLNPAGKQVSSGNVSNRNGLLQVSVDARLTGTYLVVWQVISQDTAPVSGRFVFSVHKESGRWSGVGVTGTPGLLVQVFARWLHLLGFALGFGPLAFYWWVLRPLMLPDEEAVMRRLFRLIGVGILLLLLAEPFTLLAQLVSLQAGTLFDPLIIGGILASSAGRVLAQHMGAALLLWVLLGMARQGSRSALPTGLILGIVLAFIDGQSDHAISTNPLWLGFLTNTLHILAMVVWVGGLTTLLVLWRLAELKGQRQEMVPIFGRLALAAVVELSVTGIVLAILHLNGLSALFTTGYGRALFIKSLAFLLALLLVLLSRRYANELRKRWWAGELVVLLGVLVLAGLVVSLPPPA